MLLSKTWRWAKRLMARLPDDAGVDAIGRALQASQPPQVRNPAVMVAVQCLEAPFYFGLFGALCQRLRALTGAT